MQEDAVELHEESEDGVADANQIHHVIGERDEHDPVVHAYDPLLVEVAVRVYVVEVVEKVAARKGKNQVCVPRDERQRVAEQLAVVHAYGHDEPDGAEERVYEADLQIAVRPDGVVELRRALARRLVLVATDIDERIRRRCIVAAIACDCRLLLAVAHLGLVFVLNVLIVVIVRWLGISVILLLLLLLWLLLAGFGSEGSSPVLHRSLEALERLERQLIVTRLVDERVHEQEDQVEEYGEHEDERQGEQILVVAVAQHIVQVGRAMDATRSSSSSCARVLLQQVIVAECGCRVCVWGQDDHGSLCHRHYGLICCHVHNSAEF